MADAGGILGGPILRETLAAGTIIFAICASGSQLIAGQITLDVLSDNRLCLMLATGKLGRTYGPFEKLTIPGIFAIPTLLLSFPRTLDHLSWFSIPSCTCMLVAGVVGMAVAGTTTPASEPKPAVANASSFDTAFLAVTSPVFAYAGHFMFFTMISEMKKPVDAKKAAWALQLFATV